MLNVIKRSGSLEPFDAEKIKNSLAATSDEINQPISSAALNSLVQELEQMLQEKTTVTSRQLYVMTAGVLYTRGFTGVLRQYTGYDKNAWR